MRLKDLQDLLCGNDTGLPEQHLPVFKNHQCRHTGDPVFSGYTRIAVNINFDDPDLIAQLVLYLFQNGRHHPARLAPFGRKIDQYRNIAVDDMIKICHIFSPFLFLAERNAIFVPLNKN
jgi:hypothetical protein